MHAQTVRFLRCHRDRVWPLLNGRCFGGVGGGIVVVRGGGSVAWSLNVVHGRAVACGLCTAATRLSVTCSCHTR